MAAKQDPGYLRWAFDVLDYWETCLEEAGHDYGSPQLAYLLDRSNVGYLSDADRVLLKDAVVLNCDAFLTMERRLPTNGRQIRELVGISVLTPTDLWSTLRP